MKLGISYMVFDGIELLEYATKAIRKNIDFISVVYQTTSYFGNQSDPELEKTIEKLKKEGLIDLAEKATPDLTKHHKENELRYRNIGIELSRKAGCTHHISADVDELYMPDQLDYAKKVVEDGNYDCSIASMFLYYKKPEWMIMPHFGHKSSLIHPVSNEYTMENGDSFPHPIEITRKLRNYRKFKIFKEDEFVVHHMSYIRKDIYKKLANSDTGKSYRKLKDFSDKFNTYKLGDRLCIAPDFKNRKTTLVENYFGINLED